MAARIKKMHQDEVRARIKVSQLINVLENQALSDDIELKPARLKAIEILLRKSLPDLSAVEVSGDMTIAVKEVIRRVIDPKCAQ